MACNFICHWKSIYCTQNKQLTRFVGKRLATFYLLIASIYDFERKEKAESKMEWERAILSYLSIDSPMKIVSIIKINLSLVHAMVNLSVFFFLWFQCKNLHQKYSANEISNFLVRCAPFNRLLIVFHWICPLAVHSVSISINNIYKVAAATSIKNGLSVIVVIVAIVICAIWKISN